MKYLIYFFTIILLVGINVGLFGNLKIAGAAPNLLLVFAAVLSLDKKDEDYFFVALVGGLFLEFFTGAFPGSFALAFLFLGLFLRFFAWHVLVLEVEWRSLILVFTAAVFFVAVFIRVYNAAVYVMHWSPQILGFQGFWKQTLTELLYDFLLLYPILQLARLLRYVNEILLAKQRKA